MARVGNGYLKSETRWVFIPLGYGFGSIFRPVSFLKGTKSYPLGLWARICSYNIRIREPMGFLNPIQHRAIVILFCEFITNLTSLSFNSYFSEPLGDGYVCCRFAVVVFVYACDGFMTLHGVMII